MDIVRDDAGVPHVSAPDLAGAIRGLGSCHARDRGMQMLLVRILARGRASEILEASDELLEVDRFFRRLDLGRDAPEEIAKLSPIATNLVAAYCEGVNDYFRDHKGPWELRLMGYRPAADPWTARDVLLTAKVIGYIGLAASQAAMERLIVEMVQAGVPHEKLEELFPGNLGGLDEELLRKVKLGDRVVPEAIKWSPALPRMVSSNNWAVAGHKTASGFPILCNDPHLEINRLPPVWYEVVLRWGDDRYAMGASVPGLPAIVLGRTRDVAWGATYACMDCVDSWVEECRGGKYRRGDTWVSFRARHEVIRRKRKGEVAITFHENDHGVLDGDPAIPGHYLATRWSCGEGTGAEALDAMAGMFSATTVEEGRALLGRVSNSSWNWVLADRHGNIGYQMSGRMPVRREGWSGLTPVAGWERANDWRGSVEPEQLPRILNPKEGFVASANEDLNHLAAPGVRPINLAMSTYRAGRIRALLETGMLREVTLEGELFRGIHTGWMHEMQFDLYSTQAEEFMSLLRPMLSDVPPGPAKEALLGWDLRYDERSRGASVFEAFYRELMTEIFASLGPEVLSHLWEHSPAVAMHHGNLDRIALADHSEWFAGRTREQVWRKALERALAVVPRPWSASRRMVMRHLLLGGKLGRLAQLLGLNHGPVVLRGGRATIHQAQRHVSGGREIWFGPSWRGVTDLGSDEMWTTLAGGVSDRPWSRWYGRGIADWLRGKYKRLAIREGRDALSPRGVGENHSPPDAPARREPPQASTDASGTPPRPHR